MSEENTNAQEEIKTQINQENLNLVLDAPVYLQVMLGDTTMTIGDVLKCGKGSVVPLKQKVGDPFVILLQNQPIAEGEVVDAGGNLGIKITNVLKHQVV